LIPEMKPQADEAVFDKITMSAFEGTPKHCAAGLWNQRVCHRWNRHGNRHRADGATRG
jgi:hypothetical protein